MSNFCVTKQRADRYDVNNTESLGGPLMSYYMPEWCNLGKVVKRAVGIRNMKFDGIVARVSSLGFKPVL
jgi:hypothetical protein